MPTRTGKTYSTLRVPPTLEEEKARILKILSDNSKFVFNISSEKNSIFRNLVFECNGVADKFVQFKAWRSRYDRLSINSANNYLPAFAEVDRHINHLAKLYQAFDDKLINVSDVLNSYFNYVEVQFQWLHMNMEFAKAARSLEELADIKVPKQGWTDVFPNPRLEFIIEEWKKLQLEAKLNQCFRQMEDVIKCLASNGDLY